ncbi:MAG: NUDIX domain-containing protein, partial [Pseudomonadota bacterium]|nr:NUDIX domain-containing protein [Pseudomonadota bacterium]
MIASTLPAHSGVEILSDRRAWAGRFSSLDLITFRQTRFDGTPSEARTWELFRRGRAAAVLPYDPWTDSVVLIEQFRLPALAGGVDPIMVEIPAGLCDSGEDPADTVRREAHEEMGLSCDNLEPVGDFILSPGGSDERCAIFAGRVRAPAVGADGLAGRFGLASEDEDIRVRVWPADRAIAEAVAGGFPNSVTTIALLWLAARRDSLRAAWC